MEGLFMQMRKYPENSFRLLLTLSILFFFSFLTATAIAEERQLSISGESTPDTLKLFMGDGWIIYLDGEIGGDDDKRLEMFLKQNNVPESSMVVLNSPGGSLLGGIALGRVIRKFGLNTDIGIKAIGNNGARSWTRGSCFSACSLAFIGGRFRYASSGSRYGVHRFSFSKQSKNDTDLAQLLSAAIVTYIRDMGVETNLFALSTEASAAEINEISGKKLLDLRIINNGFDREVWSIESASGNLYLKGERNTTYGINKFILLCDRKIGSYLHMIFDPQGRQDEIMGMSSHSLVINGVYHKIQPAEKRIANKWFNGIYRLDTRYMKMILNAKSVGVILRHNEEAGVFFGFDEMAFSQARSKYIGILNGCGVKLQ